MAGYRGRNQYKQMEETLKFINGQFISLKDNERKQAVNVLQRVIKTLVKTMQFENEIFEELFEDIFYGGSFYENLKVGKPDEFDIVLKLNFPEDVYVDVTPAKVNGFVTCRFQDWETEDFGHLEKFIDHQGFLLQDEFSKWIESIVDKALNFIRQNRILRGIQITTEENGPAFALKIHYGSGKFMSVDLVGAFALSEDNWPPQPFRQRKINKSDGFSLIPKAPKENVTVKERYWRLTFQKQEQDIIEGHQFGKPALRLLKKLRDTQGHKIASYYIKTVFLWEIQKEKNCPEFWGTSMSYVFMHMLKRYRDFLSSGKIPYYWDHEDNLLETTDNETIFNITNFLNGMIRDIEVNISNDPYVVARYLLSQSEYQQLLYNM